MTDRSPHYTIERYIGNGTPQWAVVKNALVEGNALLYGQELWHHRVEVVFDTEAEARALIAHMERYGRDPEAPPS